MGRVAGQGEASVEVGVGGDSASIGMAPSGLRGNGLCGVCGGGLVVVL